MRILAEPGAYRPPCLRRLELCRGLLKLVGGPSLEKRLVGFREGFEGDLEGANLDFGVEDLAFEYDELRFNFLAFGVGEGANDRLFHGVL